MFSLLFSVEKSSNLRFCSSTNFGKVVQFRCGHCKIVLIALNWTLTHPLIPLVWVSPPLENIVENGRVGPKFVQFSRDSSEIVLPSCNWKLTHPPHPVVCDSLCIPLIEPNRCRLVWWHKLPHKDKDIALHFTTFPFCYISRHFPLYQVLTFKWTACIVYIVYSR